jgi:hypothetical protein
MENLSFMIIRTSGNLFLQMKILIMTAFVFTSYFISFFFVLENCFFEVGHYLHDDKTVENDQRLQHIVPKTVELA